MRDTPRDRALVRSTVARAEVTLSARELAAALGIRPSKLASLVRLGLLEAEPGQREFSAASAARLRRILRLHEDLGIALADAAIIIELLERLDRLEAELSRLRKGG